MSELFKDFGANAPSGVNRPAFTIVTFTQGKIKTRDDKFITLFGWTKKFIEATLNTKQTKYS